MKPTVRKGFNLIELMLVIAIISLLIAIFIPALSQIRRQGKTTHCWANLQQFSVASSTYAADYDDRIFAFTWRPNNIQGQPQGPPFETKYSDLKYAKNTREAIMCQAVDLLRRRAYREDIPRIDWWIPSIYYSHLVLQDYLSQDLPHQMAICSEDWRRKNWSNDPKNNYDKWAWWPDQPEPTWTNLRWPYSSSYILVPAAYDNTNNPSYRLYQGVTHNSYYSSDKTLLGGLRLHQAMFASTKVAMFDMYDRHFAPKRKEVFQGLAQAKQPLLFFDGSVRIYKTSDSNLGWIPSQPQSTLYTMYRYQPYHFEPAALDPQGWDDVIGYYKWTRNGLGGVDFDLAEIN